MAKSDDTDVVDNPADVDRIRSAVENADAADDTDEKDDEHQDDDKSEEDDSNADDSDASDENDDDDSDEEDSDEEDDEDKDSKPAKKGESTDFKYKKYVDENPTKHIQNLENAYTASSAEGVRLAKELGTAERRIQAIVQAAAKDPDLADRLNKVMGSATTDDKDGNGASDSSPNPAENPFTVDAQTKWRQTSEKEVAEILEANPEIASDPDLGAKVKKWMDVFADHVYKEERRVVTGGEAMEMAMRHLKIDDKRTKQKVAKAAKDLAAPSRPRGTKKAAKESDKKPVSDQAYDFGSKMGVSRDKVEKYAQ